MNEDFYYSLDKLVEFGLGLSVANQMIQSMNNSIANATIPGVDNLMTTNREPVYYAEQEGKAAGPFSSTELARLIIDGRVSKETYIWKPGMPKWDIAENMPEILCLVAMMPPPIPE